MYYAPMRMTYLRHTITVDFSGDHERRIAGIGIVIQESTKRGRRGPIVEELAEAVEGIPFGQGEKYAVLRALQVASERGFRDLKIRSDYNAMRSRLQQNYNGKGFQTREGLDGRILENSRRDSIGFTSRSCRSARTSGRIFWRGARGDWRRGRSNEA